MKKNIKYRGDCRCQIPGENQERDLKRNFRNFDFRTIFLVKQHDCGTICAAIQILASKFWKFGSEQSEEIFLRPRLSMLPGGPTPVGEPGGPVRVPGGGPKPNSILEQNLNILNFEWNFDQNYTKIDVELKNN